MCGTLVVDDDKNTIGLLQTILECNGIKAEYASNGKEAAQKLMAAGPRFTLLITDLHMPEMDGVELALLAKELAPEIVVVLMTGDVFPDLRQLATGAGISMVIEKPLNPPQLLALVRDRKYFCNSIEVW